jgi:hypothetical protein
MLLKAIMVVHGDNHAKHIITLCGKVRTVLMLQQMFHRVSSILYYWFTTGWINTVAAKTKSKIHYSLRMFTVRLILLYFSACVKPLHIFHCILFNEPNKNFW